MSHQSRSAPFSEKKRHYQELWEKIRDGNGALIEVSINPFFFSRIAKAVKKEKHQDLGFRIINEQDVFRLEIKRDREKEIISFRLRGRLGLEDIIPLVDPVEKVE